MPKYKRVLLKLSGEALLGDLQYGIDPNTVQSIAKEIIELVNKGVQCGIVIGGGNLFRGEGLAKAGIDRVKGDQMGMLATVMNALAFQDALTSQGGQARVMSAISVHEVCEDFIQLRAIRHLEKNRIVIFAGGTGNPFFTTDTAASLRGVEIDAELLIKATKVDGIYDSDPKQNPNAKKYDRLEYSEVINKNLKVMDATAMVMCRDNNLPVIVYNLFNQGNLLRIVNGENVGTYVGEGKC